MPDSSPFFKKLFPLSAAVLQRIYPFILSTLFRDEPNVFWSRDFISYNKKWGT
jgi:hypothetical protein